MNIIHKILTKGAGIVSSSIH